MALAKKCDRCGNLYEPKNINICGATTNGLIRIIRNERNDKIVNRKYFDLCPECLVSLENWLKNEPMTFNEIRQAAGLEPIKESNNSFIRSYFEKGSKND